MTETRITLLDRVRDLGDGRSWAEFHAIYRPLIFGYLRGLDIKEHDAHDLTQEVFCRLMTVLPTFELDRSRGRFRTYLWRLTHSVLVDRARRRKVRDRAEQEWVRRFIEAVRTVAAGGTAMDPEVVSQLLARRARDRPLGCLTRREREVLALMAEGRTNAGIAARLVITEKAVNKHISNIFTKLDLYPDEDGNRRVLAVLAYLNA